MKSSFLLCFFLAALSARAQKGLPSVQSFDELAYPFPTQIITLEDGKTMAYMDEGSGPQTLLFLHGLGSYAPAWKKNIEGLKAKHRCIAIDLPGYGKSSKGKYEASMSAYAKVVRELIQKLGLSKPTLVGHSMGGQIALTTALAYPDVVGQLILVAPAGFETFTDGQRQWFRDVLTPEAVQLTPVEQIQTNIAWNFHNMPKDAQFMIDDRIAMRGAADFPAYCYIITQCIQGMVDEPVFDYLDQIQQRTLVIFGQQDNLIPNRFLNGGHTEAIAKQGAEKIPDCQLEMVNKAGHFVHFEQAAQVNVLIQDFMARK